jgi:uncharacterized protein
MVNLEIMTFIERCVLPRYAAFDSAHNMEHVMSVIKRSVALAEKQGVDVDMAYVIAAYHDLGLEGPRAVHHLTSGKILKADQRLKKWFSDMQIEIMKEAVEDHRASASRAPRSIYGKIVAEADRDLNPTSVIQRTIQFGKSHYPELTKEEHWNRFCEHMREKYSDAGYIKLWIEGSQNEKDLVTLRNIINNRTLLRETFEKLWSLT